MLEVSSPELLGLFNYAPIAIFLKSHHFGTCFRIIFLYVIGYNNISRPHAHDHPTLKSGVVASLATIQFTPGLTPIGPYTCMSPTSYSWRNVGFHWIRLRPALYISHQPLPA